MKNENIDLKSKIPDKIKNQFTQYQNNYKLLISKIEEQENRVYVIKNREIVHGPEITGITTSKSTQSQSNESQSSQDLLKYKGKSLIHFFNYCKNIISLDKRKTYLNKFCILNEYLIILEMIGYGAFGEVYKVYNVAEGKYYALKFHLLRTDDEFKSKIAKDNINREIYMGKNFKKCSTMLHIQYALSFEYVEIEIKYNVYCLFFEFCNGKNLDYYIKNGYLLWDEEKALMIANSILQCLYLLNQQGKYYYIHYDLKPSNLLVVKSEYDENEYSGHLESWKVKIGDWGLCMIAKEEKAQYTQSHLSKRHVAYFRNANYGAGTYYYQPPEAFEAEKLVSNKLDVFSIGVIVYEALTGKRPFCAEKSQQVIWDKGLMNTPNRAYSPHPKISLRMNQILELLLQSDVETRPCVEELIELDLLHSPHLGQFLNTPQFYKCTKNLHPSSHYISLKRKRTQDYSSNLNQSKDFTHPSDIK